MMHYRKGENVEEEIKKEDLPFEEFLPNGQDFLWMRVKGGTKVNSVVSFAKNALDKGEYRAIVWTGVGGGVVKTVSCAEIIKRTHKLYQLTKMFYSTIEEHWIPQMEGLDAIVVKRQIPGLHILMTLDEIDDGIDGVQKPGVKEEFFERPHASKSSNSRRRRGNHGEFKRKENPNQSQSGIANQRSRENPKPQTSEKQGEQETSEKQSKNQPNTPQSIGNSGAKRKQNNKKPKPRDSAATTSHSYSEHQKAQKTPQGKQKPEPMDT